MDTLSIHRVPLDALHLDPANARQHGERTPADFETKSIRDALHRAQLLSLGLVVIFSAIGVGVASLAN